MTLSLETLTNTSRPKKKRKLLGRGVGCKKGKTCGRGHKGGKSRSGYKTRPGHEGGGVPLYRRIPTRGFSNAQFARKLDIINLDEIERLYVDGETVSLETLREKGYIKGISHGIKVLGNGTLTKKVRFQVEGISKGVMENLRDAEIVN